MDENIAGMDVAVGAVGSEGERRSSVLSTAQNDGAVAALAPGQRWSLSRKREVVLRLMQGEPVEALSRRLVLPVYKLEEWRQRNVQFAGAPRQAPAPSHRRRARAARRQSRRARRMSCCGRGWRSPALWPAGGCADG